ncbi:hypothetical protein HMPREF9151_00479 [Hoylesella saccharolytica F0055]|jgi:hypothetical protein|uniref:Uncharacterized protein n=1 Tax=Hoylesella saccharolytica F0055 TaxID=1127699 RepID=L1NIG9_9BACT|nr:hypothetical protein [Hoylesella saccharolytica]EKY03136.1 hypothetical protein HMPREF9151_00479 [Hoylesella saccharolytica F0055]
MNQRILQITFYSIVVTAILLVLLFENNVFSTGLYADNKPADFLFTTILEVLTICCIPLALRLIKDKTMKKYDVPRRMQIYRRKAMLRLLLLGCPLLVNTFLYYLFMNVAFGYMAIILFLCLLFIIPTKERQQREARIDDVKTDRDEK